MKKTTKKITQFAMGSVALGGLSVAAGSVGGAGGLAGMSRMMPMLGTTIMAGEVVRHTGKLMPKKKKKKVY